MMIINVPIFDMYMESNLDWSLVDAQVKEMEQWLIERGVWYKADPTYQGKVISKFMMLDEDAVAFKLRFGL